MALWANLFYMGGGCLISYERKFLKEKVPSNYKGIKSQAVFYSAKNLDSKFFFFDEEEDTITILFII